MFSERLKTRAVDLLQLCRSKSATITTAESCTGGLIGALLTEIPGSSDVFECGFCVYSYAAKTRLLGVDADLIKTQGAVSEHVAAAMAQGALAKSGASLAVAVTGIAGPGGGTTEKPVGLVYIATAHGDAIDVEECHFTGDRSEVRLQTVERAIINLQRTLTRSSASFA